MSTRYWDGVVGWGWVCGFAVCGRRCVLSEVPCGLCWGCCCAWVFDVSSISTFSLCRWGVIVCHLFVVVVLLSVPCAGLIEVSMKWVMKRALSLLCWTMRRNEPQCRPHADVCARGPVESHRVLGRPHLGQQTP